MKSLLKIILVLIFFQASFSFATTKENLSSQFYSIQTTIDSLQNSDVGKLQPLKQAPPEYLYHWIKVESLKRLLAKYQPELPFPLKSLGSPTYGSLLVRGAPGFLDTPGLFVWHNPIGATIGGTNEIYGNHEAVLALRIKSQIRVGLLVTSQDDPSIAQNLTDPDMKKQYDLVLHVNSSMVKGKLANGLIEWALINPQIITSFSIDPKDTIQVMEVYKKALDEYRKLDPYPDKPAIEIIAGEQHSGMISYSTDSKFITGLQTKIMTHQKKLPAKFRSGWHELQNSETVSCLKVVTRH